MLFRRRPERSRQSSTRPASLGSRKRAGFVAVLTLSVAALAALYALPASGNPDHSAGDYFMFAKAAAVGTSDRKANEASCDTSNDKQADVSGSNNDVYGRIHSNADLAISGSGNIFADSTSPNPELTFGVNDNAPPPSSPDCQLQADAGNTFSGGAATNIVANGDPASTNGPYQIGTGGWPGNLGDHLDSPGYTAFGNDVTQVIPGEACDPVNGSATPTSLTGSSDITLAPTAGNNNKIVCNGEGKKIVISSSPGAGAPGSSAANPFKVTMVSHGAIEVSASSIWLAPADTGHGVLSWTDEEFADVPTAFKIGGSDVNVLTRSISFTPNSGQDVSGSNNATMCLQLIGQGSIKAAGSNTNFGPFAPGCAQPPAQPKIELQKDFVGTPESVTLRIGTSQNGSQTDSQVLAGDGTTGENSVNAGTYFVSEVLTTPGNYATTLECFNDLDDSDTVNAGDTPHAVNTSTGEVAVATGDDVLCRFTNTRNQGKIELLKDFVGTPESVTLRIGTTQDGSETDSQVLTDDGTTGENTVNTGAYFVSEVLTTPANYSVVLECFNDVNDDDQIDGGDTTHAVNTSTGEVAVATGEDVLCRFTNTRNQGKIELLKDFVGTPESVTLRIGTTQDGSETDSQVLTDDGTTGENTVNTGAYFVSEVLTTPANYATTLECFNDVNDDDQVDAGDTAHAVNTSTGEVAVGSGDDVLCRFTNTRNAAQIELQKDFVGTPESVTLRIGTTQDGSETDSQVLAGDGTTGENAVPTGTYFVSEVLTTPGNYATTLECFNDLDDSDTINAGDTAHTVNTSTGEVAVATGDDVLCRFTNTRNQGKIELLKDFVGTAESVTLRIGTTQNGSQTDSQVLAGDGTTGENTVNTGNYFVSEVLTTPANYSVALDCFNDLDDSDTINAGDTSHAVNTSTGQVAVGTGDDVLCRFTNTRNTTQFSQPRTPGFWKNHPSVTAPLLPVYLGNYSVSSLSRVAAVFKAMNCSSTKPTAVLGCLAGHLLAAKLNVKSGSDTCINPKITKADNFLKGLVVNGVTGVNYTGPSGSYTTTTAQRNLAIQLKNALDTYNNGGGC